MLSSGDEGKHPSVTCHTHSQVDYSEYLNPSFPPAGSKPSSSSRNGHHVTQAIAGPGHHYLIPPPKHRAVKVRPFVPEYLFLFSYFLRGKKKSASSLDKGLIMDNNILVILRVDNKERKKSLYRLN